jgi:hypothetical protein
LTILAARSALGSVPAKGERSRRADGNTTARNAASLDQQSPEATLAASLKSPKEVAELLRQSGRDSLAGRPRPHGAVAVVQILHAFLLKAMLPPSDLSQSLPQMTVNPHRATSNYRVTTVSTFAKSLFHRVGWLMRWSVSPPVFARTV